MRERPCPPVYRLLVVTGFVLACAPALAQTTPCTGGALPAGSGEDLEVTGNCTVAAGTYKYGYVNIFNGGSLTFADAKIDFWAKSILVENQSQLVAGSAASPIGLHGGVLTFHIYGANEGMHASGIQCKTDAQCGVPDAIWSSNGASKVVLPGDVKDYYYPYKNDGCGAGIFGVKAFAVSYGATLALYGAKGSLFGPYADSDSGRSWTRLDATVAAGAKTIQVDRVVDWQPGDQIVVTTTDYLPGHSEQVTIDSVTPGDHLTILTLREALKYPHNGHVFDLSHVPPSIGPDPHEGSVPYTARWAETRAAVALLSRSIRIVSAGDNLGDDFPAESTGYFFGAHMIVRQGFQSVHLQGVEFYQMGQGGHIGRYPIHFHLARRVPTDTLVADNSIHDSMTRWITVHATQGLTLARNVGYKSIGHGFYLEDGTEIDNKFYSNIGIFARAAVDNVQNPRKVPGILAAPFPDYTQPQENVPFHSDVDHPTVFWITNGYNDFAYNMAAGAGTCGACYWLLPTYNSGLSRDQKWEGYAAMQSTPDRASTTPLYRFEGNYCASAMNSFNTIGNTTACSGVANEPPGTNSPRLQPIPNPNPISDDMYPKVDTGGGRFATYCPPGADCTQVPKCSSGASDNCMVTVLNKYTTSFNWAETNFSAVWLRPQWYLMLNSVVSDVQNGGLTFVTGGGYTRSDIIDGHWALAKKTAFIGNGQDPATNPYAANSGPINPQTPLKCATQTGGSNAPVGNFCLLADEGISFPMSNFGINQRLFNIYDGPAYQESNAYLNISRTRVTDCQPQANGGTCGQSGFLQGRMMSVLRDPQSGCYLPNAAIGWKQPNGFYYPPAFHSRNLYFENVEIRHFVIEPLFSSTGLYQTDPAATAKRYCTWNPAMFTGFTDIDRQTELNDDDGSLTGLVNTVSVNQDPFFDGPVSTPQCASDIPENTPPGTASTSPYDYVSTVIYPGCGLGCARWSVDCTNPSCFGVPLYRQFKLPSETAQTFIRMAGQATAQRSTLTVNHGLYYIDTTVGAAQQQAVASNLNVFEAGQTYYVFQLFAKPTTRQTYQMYVGPGFDVSAGVFLARADTTGVPTQFTRGNWPSTWPAPQYDAATGLLTVTVDMSFPEFRTQYSATAQSKCQPKTFCSWNASANACGSALDPSDPLYAESQSVCGRWPTKDVDCPVGGCYAFGVTLPTGFTTGPQPNLPPPAIPFPNSPEWTSPFVTAPQNVAGQQCYYSSPPVK